MATIIISRKFNFDENMVSMFHLMKEIICIESPTSDSECKEKYLLSEYIFLNKLIRSFLLALQEYTVLENESTILIDPDVIESINKLDFSLIMDVIDSLEEVYDEHPFSWVMDQFGSFDIHEILYQIRYKCNITPINDISNDRYELEYEKYVLSSRAIITPYIQYHFIDKNIEIDEVSYDNIKCELDKLYMEYFENCELEGV